MALTNRRPGAPTGASRRGRGGGGGSGGGTTRAGGARLMAFGTGRAGTGGTGTSVVPTVESGRGTDGTVDAAAGDAIVSGDGSVGAGCEEIGCPPVSPKPRIHAAPAAPTSTNASNATETRPIPCRAGRPTWRGAGATSTGAGETLSNDDSGARSAATKCPAVS